jgi:VWFA-related protein
MSRNVIRLSLCALIALPLTAAGQNTTEAPQTTLRADSNLVVVDVVVTDSKENPIHNLKQSDFTILEDGKPQTIKVFEEHTPQPAAPLPPKPPLEVGSFTNEAQIPASGALDILLLDKLNTPMNAQAYLRDEVLKYLKKAPAGRRMAIFALTTRLNMLQGFTSDPETLRAIVEGKKNGAKASPLLNNAVSGDSAGSDTSWSDSISDMAGNDPSAQQMLSNLQQFEAEQQSFQQQLRARYTLDAFNLLARYLSNLPGRKNLIWFSGSFPVSILPDGDLQNPFAVSFSSEEEFRETSNMLAHSQVAVYPIDARGLVVDPSMSAANQGSAKNPSQYLKASQKFFQQTAQEHTTMEAMAEATGGKAFYNTNGLADALAKASEEGSNYYTIAYSPSSLKWDGRYRKIHVDLAKQGLNLTYRKGYFADNPSAPVKYSEKSKNNATVPVYNPLRTALMHGGPNPTEVVFEANVRPVSTDIEPTAAPDNQLGNKVSGPFRRYQIEFRINPKNLACDQANDGSRSCRMEFLSIVYDNDGVQINAVANGINVRLSPAQYQATLKGHVRYRQLISVPAKGEYFLRVGLRDDFSGHVGALELPVSKVAQLRPLQALAAPAKP